MGKSLAERKTCGIAVMPLVTVIAASSGKQQSGFRETAWPKYQGMPNAASREAN